MTPRSRSKRAGHLITNTRHIGDFRNWKEHDMFEATFGRLIRDLKSEESTGVKPD